MACVYVAAGPGVRPKIQGLRNPHRREPAHEISPTTDAQQQKRRAGIVPTYLLLGILAAVPLIVLGSLALIRARPEDIPAIVQALARWGRK